MVYIYVYHQIYLKMNPSAYEQVYVTDIYDQIATHFDHTRHHSWPSVRSFINTIPEGDTIQIADIGCGNGRNMLLRPHNFIGVDLSQTFVDLCQRKGLKTQWGSILDLPFKNEIFDYVICVAVIHHLSTPERRQRAVMELLRIMKPRGQILITVWGQESTQIIHDDQQDRLVRWMSNSGEAKWRYYHFFIANELDQLCRAVDPHVNIITSYEEHGNYGVILQK